MGTLYLVATPIGNLEDITLRALRVLGEVKLIGAEDTRQTRKLLDRYQIHTPIVSYHEHNKQARLDRMLQALSAGDVALVSDAGTPGLSDPGFELVRAAVSGGYRVVPVPGPSAPMAALVASGLPTDAFVFLGYLPRRTAERRRLLGRLAHEPRTMLAFEAPHRVLAALQDLEDAFGPGRPMAVARELTKVHEEIYRGDVGQVRAHFESEPPRGEFTLVLGGAQPEEAWDEPSVRAALAASLRSGMSRTDAARAVAGEAGWARRRVYRLAMELA